MLAVLCAAPLCAQDAGVFENVVDVQTNSLWRGAGVVPADRANDFEFLRRLTLDLTGRLPTVEDVQAWRADRSVDKRDRKIDQMVNSPAFLDFWSMRLARALVTPPDGRAYYFNPQSFEQWVRQRLGQRAGWDAMVTELLASTGTGKVEAAYMMQFVDASPEGIVFRTDEAAGKSASVLLGIRLRCARCHDHPHDRWTQEDFHGLAACFEGAVPTIRRAGSAMKPAVQAKPKFLGAAVKGEVRRDLGRLLTGHEQFARAFVNRAWAYLFGRGLVHPYDDFNPQRRVPAMTVLDALARQFRANKYDVRWLVKTIVSSRAYQRTSRGPAEGAAAQLELFARARVRPLTPEQHWSAIVQATQLDRATIDATSMAVIGLQSYGNREANLEMLRMWFFGLVAKGAPADAPESLLTYTGNHQIALQFMNADSPLWAGSRIASGGRLSKLLRGRADGRVILDELFFATVSRPPGPRERDRLLLFAFDRGKERGFEQLLWTLLNCDEFMFNH